MVDRTVSDVFLTLWRFHVTHAEATDSSDFVLCAECWEKIRKMEEKKAEQERALDAWLGLALPPQSGKPDSSPQGAPEGEKSTPDEGEKVHADAEKKYASTPLEGSQVRKAADDEKYRKAYEARCAAAQQGFAARKANLREVMDKVRASGVSMQSVADACGLTLNDVLDFLEGKPMTIPKLAKLGKGLGELEGKA